MGRCKNNALYTGVALDVDKRIKMHNDGKGAKSVKALGLPIVLVYQEEIGTYSAALKRERQVKKLNKEQKEELVKERQSK
jgi:putative endonuclease